MKGEGDSWEGGNYGNREQEETGTYGNSACPPMFPEHVPRTLRENPLLGIPSLRRSLRRIFSAMGFPFESESREFLLLDSLLTLLVKRLLPIR